MELPTWIERVLELPAPWRVTRLSQDPYRRRFDLWLSPRTGGRGWFPGHLAPLEEHRQVWRHLDIGQYRSFVHVASAHLPNTLDCCGDEDSGLSRAMVRHVSGMLRQGIKLSVVQHMLDLPSEALWKVKIALDEEKLTEPGAEERGCVFIPPPDARVWDSLLRGEVDLDVCALPAKLLLARLRQLGKRYPDGEAHRKRRAELYGYFERNRTLLSHELGQLQGWSEANPERPLEAVAA